MPKYLPAPAIASAVARLVTSRAQRGFTDFLILKHALSSKQEDTVPFSMRDPNFTNAIWQIAGVDQSLSGTSSSNLPEAPFFKVFGTAQGVSKKMLTNGSADTLSGPNWQNVVRIVGRRPRRGGLQPDYEEHLEELLLKQAGVKPELSDAAVWYHRASDITPVLHGLGEANEKLQKALEMAFVRDLGLTQGEIDCLFKVSLGRLDLAEDELRDTPADPEDYLPTPAASEGAIQVEIANIVDAFHTDATGKGVGLEISKSLVTRLVAALLSKRFVILTGLSGSGKTRIAQAFARWITPSIVPAEVFPVGSKIEGASSTYLITKSDSGILELEGEDGKTVALPMSIIEEWANYIEQNDVPNTISGRELRDKVEVKSKYTAYLHRLESHYKPAAFWLAAERKRNESTKCYTVVPVGADWTNNENIVGYADALRTPREGIPGSYVTKPALDLIRQASVSARAHVPHFLILDEMNLSHVERYFADVLSSIESEEPIPLHDGGKRVDDSGTVVPDSIGLPPNLFIIGTVNVDETTYMFSPKVLDRANVIEFRITEEEIESFLKDARAVDLADLDGKGVAFGEELLQQAARIDVAIQDLGEAVQDDLATCLKALFSALEKVGAEFGFRSAYEISRFVYFHATVASPKWEFSDAVDAAIMQKLLPRLHGSKTKLGPVLDELKKVVTASKYPLSAEKIERMETRLKQNGFTSYAEA